MKTSLKSLVEGALGDAERSKVASLSADASKAPASDDAVVQELFGGGESAAPTQEQQVLAEQPAEKTAGIKLAADGVKLAEALEYGANLLASKLAAEEPTTTSHSPAAMAADNGTTFTPPKAQANGAAAKVDNKPVMQNQVELRTNEKDLAQDGVEGVVPGSGQKLSSLRASLQVERELASFYTDLGNNALANAAGTKVASLEKEIAEAEKVAQDPSSPQPDLPPGGTAFMMQTDPAVKTGPLPATNQGIIDLTTAQARDASTREAGQFLSETPMKDNAVKATIGKDEGLKISSDKNAPAFPATRL